jgi:hypothetical protein
MAALPGGSALQSVSVNVIVTLAKCVDWTAIQLITSFQEAQVEQMMNGICNVYALSAILRKGVGFLIHLSHP